MTDNQDNPGINVPPPLIYVVPLILGLLLDRRAHRPFLPRSAARGLGWPLVGGAVLLNTWFLRTIRYAQVPIRTDKPVPRLTTEGPFRYSRNPSLQPQPFISCPRDALRRDSSTSERAVGHRPPTVGAIGDPARSDRARGALPGTHLRSGVPRLQDKSASLGVAGPVSEKISSRQLGE